MSEQAVAPQPDGSAQPTSEDKGAQEPTLNELLAEHGEQPDQGQPEKSDISLNSELKESVEWIREQRQVAAKKDLDTELERIGDIAGTVLSENGVQLPSQAVQDMFIGFADRNAAVKRAYLNRSDNPDAWKALVKTWAKEQAASFAQSPDQKVSAAQEALATHVQGASNQVPAGQPNKEVAAMSDVEFETWKKAQFRQAGR